MDRLNLKTLTTESRNENTMDIDQVSTLEMVKKINNEDKKVAEAVEKELPKIAEAIDLYRCRNFRKTWNFRCIGMSTYLWNFRRTSTRSYSRRHRSYI